MITKGVSQGIEPTQIMVICEGNNFLTHREAREQVKKTDLLLVGESGRNKDMAIWVGLV